MIKNLVFDFGNVFLNLDLEGALKNALDLFKLKAFPEDMTAVNCLYEQGLISTEEFIAFYQENHHNLTKEDIVNIWNFMLRDFPEYRLDFLKELKRLSQYKLILVSNTNEIHINWVKENISFYEDFKNCFDAFYLSHEIQLRKPNADIFNYILEENRITARESLFIDDNKDNVATAEKLGFAVWNIQPKTEDIITLFKTKRDLF